MNIKLGDKARDTVTGLTGIVVGPFVFLNGCVQLRVQPQELKDGKPVEATVFDYEQLELVEAAKTQPKLVATGGPHDEPSAKPSPSR